VGGCDVRREGGGRGGGRGLPGLFRARRPAATVAAGAAVEQAPSGAAASQESTAAPASEDTDDGAGGGTSPASDGAEPQLDAEGEDGEAQGASEEAAGGADDDGGDEDRPPCEDLWTSCIQPQFEEIIINSLLSVKDEIAHRKGNYELFGYDFMVGTGSADGRPQAWLIEVNSSPACDYSTPVTCPLVKKMMEDTAKVLVDLREDPEMGTGEWELLRHPHSKRISTHVGVAPQLVVQGKEILPPKGFKKKKKKRKKSKKVAAAPSACSADCDTDPEDDEGEESDGDDAEDDDEE